MPTSGIVITNTFNSESGFVPASQLDTNFSQCVNALNTLQTFGNYYVDSGSANAMAITVPSPLIVAYTAGLPLQVKVAAANADVGGTGATTINVSGLGTRNVTYPSTGSLIPGQLKTNAIISLMYDGTQFQYLGPVFGSGTITPTWTGVSGQPGVPQVNWMVSGLSACLLFYNSTNAPSNATTFGLTGLPSYLQPPTYGPSVIVPPFEDNGIGLSGPGLVVFIGGTGTVQFKPDTTGGNWTASGNKGFSQVGNTPVFYPLL